MENYKFNQVQQRITYGHRITDKQQITAEFRKYFTDICPSLANKIDSFNGKSLTDYLSNLTNTVLEFKSITK